MPPSLLTASLNSAQHSTDDSRGLPESHMFYPLYPTNSFHCCCTGSENPIRTFPSPSMLTSIRSTLLITLLQITTVGQVSDMMTTMIESQASHTCSPKSLVHPVIVTRKISVIYGPACTVLPKGGAHEEMQRPLERLSETRRLDIT